MSFLNYPYDEVFEPVLIGDGYSPEFPVDYPDSVAWAAGADKAYKLPRHDDCYVVVPLQTYCGVGSGLLQAERDLANKLSCSAKRLLQEIVGQKADVINLRNITNNFFLAYREPSYRRDADLVNARHYVTVNAELVCFDETCVQYDKGDKGCWFQLT